MFIQKTITVTTNSNVAKWSKEDQDRLLNDLQSWIDGRTKKLAAEIESPQWFGDEVDVSITTGIME